MASTTPDPGAEPTGDDQPNRIEITVADLLGRRSGSARQDPLTDSAQPQPVFALSTRHKVAVTAGALVAVGSLVATAAVFGHVNRDVAGPPGADPRTPNRDVPVPGAALPPLGPPGGSRDTAQLRDLAQVALPSAEVLAASVPRRSARGAGQRSEVSPGGRAAGAFESGRARSRSARTDGGRPTAARAGRDSALGGAVQGLGGTVRSVGGALGGTVRGVATLGQADERSIGSRSRTVSHRSRAKHALPEDAGPRRVTSGHSKPKHAKDDGVRSIGPLGGVTQALTGF